MIEIKNYRIGWWAGGKKHFLDELYTYEEAKKEVSMANFVELRPTQRGQVISSNWFYEKIVEEKTN